MDGCCEVMEWLIDELSAAMEKRDEEVKMVVGMDGGAMCVCVF